MELSKQLADFFGIASGKGVLVTSVSDDGPAAKAGVKAGDVITAVDGEEVDSPGDISRVINHKKEGEVTLTIIRNKSQQTIRVTPREGGGLSPVLDRAQSGRRIVIPRIEFPLAIDISLPRIRVTPGARIRTIRRPI
jgi:membrane-associated protease RseP (regulator of RpoE activity)